VGTTAVAAPAPRNATVTVAAGSAVPGADAVLAKNRWRMRACAKKAADLDPSSGGTVKVVAKVDAEGKVTSVTATGGSPAALTSCIQGSFYSMVFAAPDRADASVAVTVVITKGS
jgi:outer membrane biosynthesis protein TonB